jgi:hypothetical protein
MLNVYVHLEVVGVPADVVDDDAFLDHLWLLLPDAAVSGGLDGIGLTLSQWSLTRRRAARRQASRVRCAMVGLGHAGAHVGVAETIREGWRDDVSHVVGAVRRRLRLR